MVIKLTTERAMVSPSSSLERILGQIPKIRVIRFRVAELADSVMA